VLAALLEIAPAGLEQVDGAGSVEFALYGSPGELPTFPEGEAEIGGVRVQVRGEEVPDDWEERWKRFHVPVLVAGKLWVRPPWEEPAIRPGVTEVVIDPGRAFGTGTHPTTRLCLELMLDLGGRGSFTDLGCGSGVLAIAAAELGWAPVLGVDHDPLALEATRENARVNGVEVETRRYDLLREGPAPGAPTVLANLLGPLLRRLAADGFASGETPAALIASGLLVTEADAIADAFAVHGLAERVRRAEGEWAALLLAPR
jgi:ribosomal protein L11 methyltransferase